MTTTPATIPRMGRRRKTVDQSTYSGRVAVRLRELRLKKKKSVKEIAKRLGVTIQAYYAYESNSSAIPFDRIPDLCELLRIRVRDFFPE